MGCALRFWISYQPSVISTWGALMPIIPSRAGGEILVNTAVNFDQLAPSGTRLGNGTFVIVWHDTNPASDGSQASIKAQLYSANGTPIGTEFRVNTFTTGNQQDAVVAPLANGGFVIAWHSLISYPGDGDAATVAQIFDANGAKVGGEILVNTTVTNSQLYPAIAATSDGGFAITWTDFSQLGSNRSVRFQQFDSIGARVGTELLANTNLPDNQTNSFIAGLSNGSIAITWYDENIAGGDGSGGCAKLRIFTGGVGGGEIVVNTTTSSNQAPTGIAALTGGRFAIVFDDNSGLNGDPDSCVRVQIFSATGTKIGGEILVNTTTASRQNSGAIAALPDGGFVITWDDLSLTLDGSGYAVFGQIFDANGARVGSEFLVNTTTNDFQRDSTIIALNDGFFVAFTDVNGSVGETNLGPNIRGQRFAYSAGLAFLADPGDDSYAGGAGIDTVDYSNAISPVFADARIGASADGFGATDVFTSIENLTGSALADILIGSDVSNVLTGGAGADQLYGLGGDDELIGGAGPNTLQGGTGNDTYRVSDAGDSIVEFVGEGIDSVFASSAIFTLPDHVENLTAANATAAFAGIGNAIDNVIRGGSARDSLSGGGGNDTLYGGSGAANELVGGTGDDTYIIEAAGDSIVEYLGEGTDIVQTALATFTLGTNIENLTFTGSTSFAGIGNALDNVIRGGANADSLSGGDGNDTLHGGAGPTNELVGGAGDDIYIVQVRGDSVVEAAGQGIDTVQTNVSTYELSANVENLTYTGAVSFIGVGNAGDNRITGGARADQLFGRDGNDVLTGGLLNDQLLGGNGADTFRFVGNDGIDRIYDFTSGTDRIELSSATFGTPTFALVQGFGPQTASTTSATFLYDSQTGYLSFDADGTGTGAAIIFALLNTGLTLQASDFSFG